MNAQYPLALSLFIPVFNEAEKLPSLYVEITESCSKLGKTHEISWT